MRIAFFTDTYHPSLDGVVRSIDLFSRQLRAEGHQVRLFAPAPPQKREQERGVTYAPSTTFPPYPQYRMPVWIDDVASQAAAWRPDVVHCHAVFGLGLAARDAARRSGAPLVGTFHTMVPSAMHYVTPHRGMQKIAEHLSWEYLRWFYRPFDVVVAPSRHLQSIIAGHQLSSTVVPNPVDTRVLKPGKTRRVGRALIRSRGPMSGATPAGGALRSRGSAADAASGGRARSRQPMMLYLGRVAQEKNIDYLLKLAASPAWKKWGAHLVVAGDGPYRPAMQKGVWARHLQNNVQFLGRVPQPRLAALYRSADLTVLPSRFETQGLVALESMACGTPVACFEKTALAEVVQPGVSGVRWKEEDGVEVAVRALQRGVAGRKKLSTGARKVAMRYSVSACTRQLLGVYRKAILEKKRE